MLEKTTSKTGKNKRKMASFNKNNQNKFECVVGQSAQ